MLRYWLSGGFARVNMHEWASGYEGSGGGPVFGLLWWSRCIAVQWETLPVNGSDGDWAGGFLLIRWFGDGLLAGQRDRMVVWLGQAGFLSPLLFWRFFLKFALRSCSLSFMVFVGELSGKMDRLGFVLVQLKIRDGWALGFIELARFVGVERARMM